MQYRHRYYCAGLGRFCQRDVLEYNWSFNLYDLAGDMPGTFSDPLGLEPFYYRTWRGAKRVGGWIGSGVRGAWRAGPGSEWAKDRRADAFALASLGVWGARTVNPFGAFHNRLSPHDLTFPSWVISGRQEVQKEVREVLAEALGKLCSLDPPASRDYRGEKETRLVGGPAGALLHQGTLRYAVAGSVEEDKSCESCKRFEVRVEFEYYDEFDANSYAESGTHWLEGAVYYLQELQASGFNLHSRWAEERGGCCSN